jgi:hypothetical protein
VGSPENSGRTQKDQEARRYREAADLALEHLEWCIRYLHRIRKPSIAEALRHNRTTIVKRHQL